MEFDEVVVAAENLLGKENQGFEIIMSSMMSIDLLRANTDSHGQPSPMSASGLA
jgi:alkylation response protein AidB-like acyl-CoA dehydrogenase